MANSQATAELKNNSQIDNPFHLFWALAQYLGSGQAMGFEPQLHIHGMGCVNEKH